MGFSFLEIEEISITGFSVYIQQKFVLASNVNDILAQIAKHSLGRWVFEKLLPSKNRKYIIDRIDVVDMHVHIMMQGMPAAKVVLPSMNVSGIGVKENGVTLPDLIAQTLKALTWQALEA